MRLASEVADCHRRVAGKERFHESHGLHFRQVRNSWSLRHLKRTTRLGRANIKLPFPQNWLATQLGRSSRKSSPSPLGAEHSDRGRKRCMGGFRDPSGWRDHLDLLFKLSTPAVPRSAIRPELWIDAPILNRMTSLSALHTQLLRLVSYGDPFQGSFHQAEAVLNRSRMLGFPKIYQFSRLESVIIPLLTLNTSLPLRRVSTGTARLHQNLIVGRSV